MNKVDVQTYVKDMKWLEKEIVRCLTDKKRLNKEEFIKIRDELLEIEEVFSKEKHFSTKLTKYLEEEAISKSDLDYLVYIKNPKRELLRLFLGVKLSEEV